MDTYENDPREYENAEANTSEEESTLSSAEETLPFQFGEDTAPAAKKRSPFEDSPYRMNQETRYEYGYTASAGTVKAQKGGAWKGVVAAVLAVALVAGSCLATAGIVNSRWEKKTKAMTTEFDKKLSDLEAQLDVVRSASSGVSVSGSPLSNENGGMTPAMVYEQCKRSVVAITNYTTGYYGQGEQAAGSGSGFILSEDGYVVTNCHVVEGATRLTVTTFDGEEHEAELVGSDETNDIALLKIQAEGLQAVTVGSSDALIIGDQVVAIGNPLGELTSTQTVGYISGKDREVSTDGNVITMLQTDAAINSGNSGGPLFNMKGEVVGITTAKYSGTSSSGASIEGIGFAIPIDDVKDMLEDLKTLGYVSGAYLGVMVRDFDTATAELYNLPVGVYVESVTDGSCAQRGGIRASDMILSLGDYQVESMNDLTRALRQYEAGDTVSVTVFRSGSRVELTVTLDEKPHDEVTQEQPSETQPSQQYPGYPDQGSMEDWMEDFYNYFAPFYGQG